MEFSPRIDQGKWVMDSGCTYHMTPERDWFTSLRHAQGSVILGDGKTCNVEGIGLVQLRMADGTLRLLDEVRYIPTMRRNLISLAHW